MPRAARDLTNICDYIEEKYGSEKALHTATAISDSYSSHPSWRSEMALNTCPEGQYWIIGIEMN
jgi:plasmid stabilization system protein ParE